MADTDGGWRPWPSREHWTAHELAGTWDGADDPMAFLASLSDREWALVRAAASDRPDAEGYSPSLLVRETAQEMVAAVSGRAN